MDSGGRNTFRGDEQGAGSSRSNNNGNRHTQQIQFLEEFFKNCPYPNTNQQKQISERLHLDPNQVMFWFQNRRTQLKARFEQVDFNFLASENEKLKSENLALREAIRNVLCYACGGPCINRHEHQSIIAKLQSEYDKLRKAYGRVVAQVAHLTGKSLTEVNSRAFSGSPVDFTVGDGPSMGMRDSSQHFRYSSKNSTKSDPAPGNEKSVMKGIAVTAMKKLLVVLQSNEPMWTNKNGRYSLNKDYYEKVVMRPHHFKHNFSKRLESSKNSCDVAINASVLVNMILDSSAWLDLFPTLVTNAETAQVVETGTPGSRSGSLHLMYEVIHTLSLLVEPREFGFLRYCEQVKMDTWVIVDVSYWVPRGINNDNSMPLFWKHPSGCMIQDMPDGHSKVTWVELVEVDERASTHRFYKDLINTGLVFSADRWISTLKQMCERAMISNEEPAKEHGPNWSSEGKWSVMKLSRQMVKLFCATLNMMNNRLDMHQESGTDNSGVRVSTRKCTDPCKPEGLVFCATISICLPFHPRDVFAFFQDRNMRSQWDFLSHGNQVTEIARVVSGRHPTDMISVVKLAAPDESHIVILQESFMDLLGYYLVFAPIELTDINKAVAGLDASNTLLIPSGFVITGDGRGISPSNKSSDGDGGSLVTMTFQILFNDSAYTEQKHREIVGDMNNLIISTMEKIKAALSPSSSSNTVIPPASTI